VFRAASGTIALIAVSAIGAFLLGDAALRAGWAQALLLAPWVLLVVWSVYVMMYASCVVIDASGATVQNYVRRTWMPWARIEDVRMRWQAVFTLDDGTEVKAFGGPVAGRPGRAERRAKARPGSAPPALQELGLIQDQWQTAREEGAPKGDVRRSWDLGTLCALAVIVVWAFVAVIITGGPS
jgi:hypothetical protein